MHCCEMAKKDYFYKGGGGNKGLCTFPPKDKREISELIASNSFLINFLFIFILGDAGFSLLCRAFL